MLHSPEGASSLPGWAAAQRASLAEAGTLLSYGVNISDFVGRAAVYVDKILRSAKPDDLDPAALAASLGAEWKSLWVLLAVATANVVLGIWRPRLRLLVSSIAIRHVMAPARARSIGNGDCPNFIGTNLGESHLSHAVCGTAGTLFLARALRLCSLSLARARRRQ